MLKETKSNEGSPYVDAVQAEAQLGRQRKARGRVDEAQHHSGGAGAVAQCLHVGDPRRELDRTLLRQRRPRLAGDQVVDAASGAERVPLDERAGDARHCRRQLLDPVQPHGDRRARVLATGGQQHQLAERTQAHLEDTAPARALPQLVAEEPGGCLRIGLGDAAHLLQLATEAGRRLVRQRGPTGKRRCHHRQDCRSPQCVAHGHLHRPHQATRGAGASRREFVREAPRKVQGRPLSSDRGEAVRKVTRGWWSRASSRQDHRGRRCAAYS